MHTDDQHMAQLLAEIGFMAANHYYLEDALAIADGLRIVKPKSAVPYVIQALVDLSRRNATEAIKVLREKALPLEPDNESVKVVLAIALQKLGHNRESEEILVELTENKTDKTPAVADELLQELRKG